MCLQYIMLQCVYNILCYNVFSIYYVTMCLQYIMFITVTMCLQSIMYVICLHSVTRCLQYIMLQYVYTLICVRVCNPLICLQYTTYARFTIFHVCKVLIISLYFVAQQASEESLLKQNYLAPKRISIKGEMFA